MAANYSYRCPYCKHHIKTTSAPVRFESPLKPCPKCSKIYVDPYSEELALKPYRPQPTSKILLSCIPYGIGSAVFIGFIAFLITKSNSIGLLFLGVSSVACWLLWSLFSILTRNKEDARRLKKWQESEQRLKNPNYASSLKNLGYHVPVQYLPSGFKPSPESAPYQRAKVSVF